MATTGLIGAGVGIGVVFGALIIGVSRNPSLRGQLFSYAILGFAFAEATGLFALMMAFLLLYVAQFNKKSIYIICSNISYFLFHFYFLTNNNIIFISKKESNKIYSWGYNKFGQLGLGDKSNRNIPTNIKQLNNKNIILIEAGYYHNFCILGNFTYIYFLFIYFH